MPGSANTCPGWKWWHRTVLLKGVRSKWDIWRYSSLSNAEMHNWMAWTTLGILHVTPFGGLWTLASILCLSYFQNLCNQATKPFGVIGLLQLFTLGNLMKAKLLQAVLKWSQKLGFQCCSDLGQADSFEGYTSRHWKQQKMYRQVIIQLKCMIHIKWS